MFQSTCPIKSPTFQKCKKNNQLQKQMSTSIENSADKNSNLTSNQVKEGQLEEEFKNNKNLLKLNKSTIAEEEQYKGTSQQLQTFVDNNIKSLAQVEQSQNTLEQQREGIQLGFIADIKSIRNHKANAFRSRLNLSSSYHDADQDEFRKKSASISSDFVMLIEPVSIKDLQKANSTNYNTAESPGVSKKYKAQQKRAQYLNQKINQQIEETNDEYKDYENQLSQHLDHEEQSSTHDLECSIEKRQLRKFERKQLRIKVNQIKDEQKEEVWDSQNKTIFKTFILYRIL